MSDPSQLMGVKHQVSVYLFFGGVRRFDLNVANAIIIIIITICLQNCVRSNQNTKEVTM